MTTQIAQALREAYALLPRPTLSRSPETTQAAYNWGVACGKLGLGVPDFPAVTAMVGRNSRHSELPEDELRKMRNSRFRAACAGHKHGRRLAGLPDLPSWARSVEEEHARNAS